MNKNVHLTRRALLATAAGGAVAAAGHLPALAQERRFAGREVVFTTFSSTRDLFQQEVGQWLQQTTGGSLILQPMLDAEGYARMQAELQDPQIDMFVSLTENELDAKAKGISQKIAFLDNAKNIPAQYLDPDGFWVHWAVISEGILYRTDKVTTPPTSYLDLFKPEYAGRVMFPSVVSAYGLDFLVMMAKIHGGSEDNIDPGFEALKRLRASGAHVVRGVSSEVQQQFSQGDMWLLPFAAGNAHQMRQVGLPIGFATAKEGAPATFLSAFVTKNSKNGDMAAVVIDRILGPEVQSQLAKRLGYGPVLQTADTTGVDIVFPRPDQLAQLDRAKIRANRQQWTERFLREIAS